LWLNAQQWKTGKSIKTEVMYLLLFYVQHKMHFPKDNTNNNNNIDEKTHKTAFYKNIYDNLLSLNV
jgi:hypothetical protein